MFLFGMGSVFFLVFPFLFIYRLVYVLYFVWPDAVQLSSSWYGSIGFYSFQVLILPGPFIIIILPSVNVGLTLKRLAAFL